jgi:hypothetical protein
MDGKGRVTDNICIERFYPSKKKGGAVKSSEAPKLKESI